MWVPIIPYEFAKYSAVAIMAALDSILGATNAILKDKFEIKIFVSGFFINSIIAIALTLIGEKLDANIFLAAIFVFVYRIFNNFSSIRRELLERYEKKKEKAS
jgi:small basic protein